MIRPILEGFLVTELVKAGIPEPKRVYRPALEARDSLDKDLQEGSDRVYERLKKTLPWLTEPKSRGHSPLYEWEMVGNGLEGKYSLRERLYNPDFSIVGVNAAIMTGQYDEEFDIAEAETESKKRGNDIFICTATDNGIFSIVMAENLGSKYDIREINKLKRKGNPKMEDFAKEVAKLLSGAK